MNATDAEIRTAQLYHVLDGLSQFDDPASEEAQAWAASVLAATPDQIRQNSAPKS